MIKLADMIFESIDEVGIKEELEKAKGGHSNVVAYMWDVDKFYNRNKDKIGRILGGAEEFRYLGSGGYGCAFSLGNGMVLKFQKENERTEAILDLYKGRGMEGIYYPMVYDYGILEGERGNITYTILEKFESEGLKRGSENDLLMTKVLKWIRVHGEEDIKEVEDGIRDWYGDRLPEFEFNLRLSSDWIKRLIMDMRKLKAKGIYDFHAGNLGIRRIGGEGYFVFFD